VEEFYIYIGLKKKSDIYITNIRQFWRQLFFFSCDWTKTIEREKRRNRIKTHVSMREDCFKNGQKVVVQR